jgi:hypothetical protein
MEDQMPIYMKVEGIDAEPLSAREATTPSISEIVVTKSTDAASADPSTSETLVGFGDGSVRPTDTSPVASGPGDENPVASRPR